MVPRTYSLEDRIRLKHDIDSKIKELSRMRSHLLEVSDVEISRFLLEHQYWYPGPPDSQPQTQEEER